MSFNAGAIEASLTLGRSQWLKDLRTTKKEIADLERRSITIGIDADATNAEIVMDNIEMLANDLDNSTYAFSVDANTAEANSKLEILEEKADRLDNKIIGVEADADITNAMIQLDILENQADLLDSDPINMKVDVDSGDTELRLLEIAQLANNLDGDTIDMNVDLDGYATVNAQMLTIEGQASVLDGRTINMDVDIDRDNLEALVGSAAGGGGGGGGYLGLLKILIYALIALSPVLAVSISSATAAIVAFTAAVAGAAGAALVLAGGLVGLVARFKDTDPSEYTPQMQAFADSVEMVTDAWNQFLDGIEGPGFALMAQGLEIVAGVLPDMVPLFNAVADAMSGVLDGLASWIDSPQYQEMLDFFGGFGVDMLVQFLEIGGNLLVFFGELFAAIEPFAREMMQGIEDLTGSWADWAAELDENRAFQDFMENASTYGPMVLDMLGSLLDAFMNLGQALEPFAGPMLEGLTFFFDLIAGIDPTNLTILIGLFAGLWAGANIVAPILGAVAGGLEAITIALGIGLGPLALIVGAVGLVAYAFWDLWQKGGEMRDQITEVWNTMRDVITPIVADITAAIQNNIGPLREWWSGIWASIQSIVESAFIIISQVIELALNIIKVWWEAWGQNMIGIVEGMFKIIGGLIQAGFAVIKTIFGLIKAAVTGDWGAMWGILKEGASSFWGGIQTAFRGWIGVVSNIWDSITAGPVRAWNAVFGPGGVLRDNWNTFTGWLDGQWTSLINGIGNIKTRIAEKASDMWDGVKESFKSMYNSIVGWWNNLSLRLDIPDKIPGMPDSFTISTPDVGGLATGGYLTDPTLAIVGEAGPEIVAPEPVLTRIVQENSGGKLDVKALASAIYGALAPMFRQMGWSIDQLAQVIEESGAGLSIDARQYGNTEGNSAAQLASLIAYQLRLAGFGGKVATT